MKHQPEARVAGRGADDGIARRHRQGSAAALGAGERSEQRGGQQAGPQERQGDAVGQQLVIDVDAGERDQRPGDEQGAGRGRAEAEVPCDPGGQQAGGELDHRIARRDRRRQAAQRPRSTSQLITGMFCHAVMGALQAGQAERGVVKAEAARAGSASGDAVAAARARPTAESRAACARHSRSSMIGQPVNDHVEKAADTRPSTNTEPANSSGLGRVQRGDIVQHGLKPVGVPWPVA